jgi:hypothetical protein
MNVEAIKIWLKKSKSNLMIARGIQKEPDILWVYEIIKPVLEEKHKMHNVVKSNLPQAV